jgi:hypothetical protein
MQLRWLVLACAVFSSWQGRASACSVILPEQQSLDCGAVSGGAASGDAASGGAASGSAASGSAASGSAASGSVASGGAAGAVHTSVANAQLQLDGVEVKRSRYAPPGRGDCGELGSTKLRFSLAGNASWPEDVAVRMTLREGTFSYFQPQGEPLQSATGWLVLAQAGAVRFFGPDDPTTPLALVLEARAVDCSGAVSAPIEVRISDPGRTPDAGTSAASPAAAAAGAGGAVQAASAKDGAAQTATPAPSSCAPSAPVGAHGALASVVALAGLLVVRRCRSGCSRLVS